MDGLTIFWTKTAIKQRDYIFDYWNKRNKSRYYSKKLNLAIQKRIESLKNNAKMGIQTDFGETRAISMRHYSILYETKYPKIFITGFWDNRQDPKKLLKFLKENSIKK